VNIAFLIVSYDSGTDTYERAYIYPNSDGSWGYRTDSETEKSSRAITEKVYTEKVSHTTVSAIPVRTPTPAITSTTVTTATPTPTSTIPQPRITSIDPDNGLAGTTVSITDLVGYDFVSGATVTLVKSGETNISASSVSVASANRITCTFSLLSNTTVGYWDLVVTNPNGLYHKYQNGFRVRENVGATDTTSSTSGGTATINSVSPSTVISGGVSTYQQLTVLGSNFPLNGYVKLTRSGSNDISSSSYYLPSTTSLQVSFNIPAGSNGSWDLLIMNSDGTTAGTLSNAVYIS
jgi:hypothetical protein